MKVAVEATDVEHITADKKVNPFVPGPINVHGAKGFLLFFHIFYFFK